MSWYCAARPLAPPARWLAVLALAAWLSPSAPGQTFTDNFNAGNDANWDRYQPLSGFGAGGTYSFPAGGYQIQAATSPNPGTLGPGRAGSFVRNIDYTTFQIAADVVNWNNALNQSFGLAARLTQIGLGTTDGVLFLYDPTGTPTFTIYRATDEAVATLAAVDVTLDPARDYRFQFSGTGANLSAQVFDLTGGGTALFGTPLTANDPGPILPGRVGLIVASNTAGTSGPADATFDNFAAVPEPASWALMGAALAGAGMWRRRRR